MRIAIRITELSAGSYRACCPSLPGCAAAGGTPREAQDSLEKLISAYLYSFDVAEPRLELSVTGPAEGPAPSPNGHLTAA